MNEMGVTALVHPCYMLWLSSGKHMPQLRSLCLTSMLFTLSIWKRCLERYSLSSPGLLFLNVLFNPDIPDGLSYVRILPWTQAGIFHLRQLVYPVTRSVLSFVDLQAKHQIPTSLLYFYMHFKIFSSLNLPHYLWRNPPILNIMR